MLQSMGLQRVGHDGNELKNVAEKRHSVCVCVHAHVLVLLYRVKDFRKSFLEDVVSK